MPNGHPEEAYEPPPITREDLREIVRDEVQNIRDNVCGDAHFQPTYTQLADGRWQWNIGMSGFDTRKDAVTDWKSFRH